MLKLNPRPETLSLVDMVVSISSGFAISPSGERRAIGPDGLCPFCGNYPALQLHKCYDGATVASPISPEGGMFDPEVVRRARLDSARPLDIIGGDVEVLVRDDGKVLWVNVDGICALRICQIDSISVVDKRPRGKGRR